MLQEREVRGAGSLKERHLSQNGEFERASWRRWYLTCVLKDRHYQRGRASSGREASRVHGPRILQSIQGSKAKSECAEWLEKKSGGEKEADMRVWEPSQGDRTLFCGAR